MKISFLLLCILAYANFFGQIGKVGINTLKPTRSLDINGNIRIRSLTDKKDSANVYDRVLVGNSQGDIDFVPIGSFDVETPAIKTIKFTVKNVKIPSTYSYVTEAVNIGNVSIRYRNNSSCIGINCENRIGGKLEFKFFNAAGAGSVWTGSSMLVRRSSFLNNDDTTSPTAQSGEYRTRFYAGTIKGVPLDDTTSPYTVLDLEYNPETRDTGSTMLSINSTGDVYRISIMFNGSLPAVAADNIAALPRQATIFIERLTDD
ncbi:hypothetical protein [Chryseobacterium sp. Bi04]|uniref:hypothetical protein n=1 Tax=Chryseobacterium sp. Bi04 TaxID=2822345 RepID=UPI001DBDE06C|nr:hypothetical protein [Chryseobacterium sp. Bi04]CAH0157691.1 hypothetical protein SRABI04_00929 [Chryseobacterium sp. Bi04]